LTSYTTPYNEYMSKKKFAVVAICENEHTTGDWCLILRDDYGGDRKRIYIKCPTEGDDTAERYKRKGWYETIEQAREYAACFYIGTTFILPWDDDYKLLIAEAKIGRIV
jgi:hypothetical protein